MSLIGSEFVTLMDHAKRLDPEGKVDIISEMLTKENDILQDMIFKEGNLPTGHRTTIRTGLPTAVWRKLNYGVPTSKSRTQQVTDTVGLLEAYAEVDKEIADLNGNTAQFRLSEDEAFREAMNQAMVQTVFYGDVDVYPERFHGLAVRYPYIDSPNVVDGGGGGENHTSIWIIKWGTQVFGIYPKGSKAGWTHEDKGQVTLEDAAGGKYEGYRSHYLWKMGLCVRNWKYVVRIANIDVANLPANIPELLITALNKLPKGAGNTAIYSTEAIRTKLDILAMNKSNAQVTVSKDMFGQRQTNFWGVPMRICEGILETEAGLTATP